MESSFFNYWLIQVVAMLVTVLLIPRLRLTGITGALFMVAAISAVNFYLWDSSLFFSVPENFSARALELLAINGVIFWVLVKVLPGIEIDGVVPAFAAPVVFTLCGIVAKKYGGAVDWAEVVKLSTAWLVETMQQLKERFSS